MAAQEKTEEPTAKKKADARKKGNVAKSRDLSAAMILLAAIYLLKYLGPYLGFRLMGFTEKMVKVDMAQLPAPDRGELLAYLLDWALWLAVMIGPFILLIAVVALAANFYQTGFLWSSETLKLKFDKLNPVAGLKRIFSMRNLVMLVMNLTKLLVVMAVAWSYMYLEFQNVLVMVEMETAGTLAYTADKVLTLARNIAVLLLILGFADFQYQKYRTNKDLKMTKQEVKEEYKQMEGDPMVKQQRRKKQMELAMNRMMSEVPQAEVVVRNPTHFAVAISYKPGMAAPVVVAKGRDKVAERIIEAAREARVPMVQNPPLARQLYRMVEIGDPIPEELFATVAEILASVMDAEKKQRMMQELSGQAA